MKTLLSKIEVSGKKLRDILFCSLIPWKDLEVIFIVSTGRTGTEFLANFFNENFKQTIAYHEPAPDLFDLGVDSVRKKKSERKIFNCLKRARFPLIRSLGKNTIYVESNNNLVLLLPTLIKAFPKAKFVHVIRNPKSYVRSAYSKSHGKAKYTLFGESDPRKRLTAKDDINDPFYSQWDHFSQFQKVCWHWHKYNLMIERALANHKGKIQVDYEKLFYDSTKETLLHLVKFLDLDKRLNVNIDDALYLFTNKMNQTHKYKLGAFEEWPDHYKKEYYSVLGEIGYANI